MNTDGHSGTLFSHTGKPGRKRLGTHPPARVRELACRLSHFVVENAKTARAELKRLEHPLPMRELDIRELPASPGAEDLETLLAPLLGARISA